MALTSFAQVQAFIAQVLKNNSEDASGAPHGNFWSTTTGLDYEQFTKGNVPGVDPAVPILVVGEFQELQHHPGVAGSSGCSTLILVSIRRCQPLGRPTSHRTRLRRSLPGSTTVARNDRINRPQPASPGGKHVGPPSRSEPLLRLSEGTKKRGTAEKAVAVLEHSHDGGQIGGRGHIHAELSVCPCALGKHLYDHPPEIYGQSDQHHEGRGREGGLQPGLCPGPERASRTVR